MVRVRHGWWHHRGMLRCSLPGAAVAALVSASLLLATAAEAQAQAGPTVGEPRPAPSAAAADAVRTEALRLMQAGRFADAVAPAREGLRLNEVLHGPDAVETAVAAHNLGFLLRRTGRDSEAGVLLERALAIYELKLRAVHEDTRNLVGELGQIYVKSGRGGDLAAIYRRLIARAATEGDGELVGVAHMATNLGFVLRGLDRHEESEAAFSRAVAIYTAARTITGDPYRLALLALLDRLEQTGRLDRASEEIRRALALLDDADTDVAALKAQLHNRSSRIALEMGKLDEARTSARAAISLAESRALPKARAGELDALTEGLNNLARADRAGADLVAAEAAYKRALSRLEAAGDKVNRGIVMDNLAVLYLSAGRAAEAERLQKSAMGLIEQALGRDHRSVGVAAANLSATLAGMRRFEEAEPLLRRAIAIYEAQPRRDAVTLGIATDNLAGLLRETGRHREARDSYQKAMALLEANLPPGHPRIATAHNNLGRFLLDTGAYQDAEITLRNALELSEKAHGATSPSTAIPAANLAEALARLGQHDEARRLYARALGALEAVHGRTHVALLDTLVGSGRLELADSKPEAAGVIFERATAIALAAHDRGGFRKAPETGGRSSGSGALHGSIEAIWRSDRRATAADRALELAQWDTTTSAAEALAALGARAAAQDPVLGALARERQDLAASWTAADKRLTELLAQSASRDGAVEGEVRARLASVEARIAAIDDELTRRFPRYGELSSPSPLSLPTLQQLLSPAEAALQFLVTAEATFVWAVTATGIAWHRAPITEGELTSLVQSIRCGLDRAAWDGSGQQRCARLLGLDPDKAPAAGEPLPFDVGRAHALHRILIAPLAVAIGDRDILAVLSTPLSSLPLQVLATAPSDPDRAAAYADVAWLGRRHAITVLPSLASLASLRSLAGTSRAARPYLGIGNPLLTGTDGNDRRAFQTIACTASPDTMRIASTSTPATTVIRGVDRETLRRQPPLPETAEEICRVAGAVGADAASMLLGGRATEAGIKALSSSGELADARIVHFATHGLLAGEARPFLSGKAEPALLLTPPASSSDEDDGLLTASEVAALRLDADWVVLSACNTAGGERGGAEPLSGLARAFFHAGARSLLVSHWAVDSASTVALMTGVFEARARHPDLTEARALQTAMNLLIETGGQAAHPSNWSAFVVVGGRAAPVPAVAISMPGPPSTSEPTTPLHGVPSPAAKPPAQREKAARRPQKAAPKPGSPESDWQKDVFRR